MVEGHPVYIRDKNRENKTIFTTVYKITFICDVSIQVYLNLDFMLLMASSFFGFSIGAMFCGTTIFGNDEVFFEIFKRVTSSNKWWIYFLSCLPRTFFITHEFVISSRNRIEM